MKKALILLTAILTLFTASSVFAEIRGGELNGSLFIGGYTFDGLQHLKTNVAHGFRLGYDINRNWGVETQFAEVSLKSTSAAVTTRGDQYSISGNILYHFMPQSKLVPFVVLGGGWTKSTRSNRDNEDATLDYGAGIKYFLNDWLALRMDLRHLFSFHTANRKDSGYWQNYEYTAGLSFQFAGSKAATPAAIETEAPARMAETLPASSPSAMAANTAVPEPVRDLTPAAAPVRILMPAPAPVTARTEPLYSLPSVRRAVKSSASCNCSQQAIATVLFGSDNVEIGTDIGFETYNVFQLTAPTRMVIDICCTNDGMGSRASKYTVNRLGISTVRVAGHPDKLRIVFDSPLGHFPNYRFENTATGIRVLFNDW